MKGSSNVCLLLTWIWIWITDYSNYRNRTKNGAIEGKLLAILLLQILLDSFGRIIIFRNNPLLKQAIKYFFSLNLFLIPLSVLQWSFKHFYPKIHVRLHFQIIFRCRRIFEALKMLGQRLQRFFGKNYQQFGQNWLVKSKNMYFS